MGLLTSMQFNSLEELLADQLRDLYDTERRMIEALPKMANAASSEKLREAFHHHLEDTRAQVDRLEQAFRLLGKPARQESCEAIKELVKEGEKMIQAKGDADVKDAALIAAAQRVEHYEMASYGSARNFAQRCGRQEIAELLQETLREEAAADQMLTEIAEAFVNPTASKV